MYLRGKYLNHFKSDNRFIRHIFPGLTYDGQLTTTKTTLECPQFDCAWHAWREYINRTFCCVTVTGIHLLYYALFHPYKEGHWQSCLIISLYISRLLSCCCTNVTGLTILQLAQLMQVQEFWDSSSDQHTMADNQPWFTVKVLQITASAYSYFLTDMKLALPSQEGNCRTVSEVWLTLYQLLFSL